MSGITHAKVSAKSDGADPSQVLPSDWNADHVVTEINIAAGGDTQDRVTIGLDGSDNPQILLGDGTDAPDVVVWRSAAGHINIGSLVGGTVTTLNIWPASTGYDWGTAIKMFDAVGDTQPTLMLDTLNDDFTGIGLGPGGSTGLDVILFRRNVGWLRLQPKISSQPITLVIDGFNDQTSLWLTGTTAQILLGSPEDPAESLSSGDLRLSRSAASTLNIDDNTGGAGHGATIRLSTQTSPGTPESGYGYLYFSSVDKKLHVVDDAGVDTALS